jgi:hypothetical protein
MSGHYFSPTLGEEMEVLRHQRDIPGPASESGLVPPSSLLQAVTVMDSGCCQSHHPIPWRPGCRPRTQRLCHPLLDSKAPGSLQVQKRTMGKGNSHHLSPLSWQGHVWAHQLAAPLSTTP